MSDAPETIWAQVTIRDPNLGTYATTPVSDMGNVRYRRADLPPTLEAVMQLPEVRALVEASTQFAKASMSGSDLGWVLVNLEEALAPFTVAKP